MIIETQADVDARAAKLAAELAEAHQVRADIAAALAADLVREDHDCFERWRRLKTRTGLGAQSCSDLLRKHGLFPEVARHG